MMRASNIFMRFVLGIILFVLVGMDVGCTRPSLRVAIASQQRADEVQQAVFDRQHDAARVLLYRDMVSRLADAGAELDAAQAGVLNDVWNERDLLEFWALQHERSRALRVVGVDAKLFADQSPAVLLMRSLDAHLAAADAGIAAHVAEHIVNPALETQEE